MPPGGASPQQQQCGQPQLRAPSHSRSRDTRWVPPSSPSTSSFSLYPRTLIESPHELHTISSNAHTVPLIVLPQPPNSSPHTFTPTAHRFIASHHLVRTPSHPGPQITPRAAACPNAQPLPQHAAPPRHQLEGEDLLLPTLQISFSLLHPVHKATTEKGRKKGRQNWEKKGAG